ncbi:VacB/RNase II family 3'-5' exoribonuclease [Romeria aff. gracilis LEGE 07310]|uniref:VacB/RNase II family 3'-5' exoribonuclease n=1 Tax=Vasconcelosia minhoensis LEGE 07310 TaxID=915328 RepID=A0A8J7DNG1_9CYAN|nr:ribonuclease R family protein [Romeria gracilis]MBE9080031.1 VacB/RNase II family 3'-5' exoribonuclease [Romeria aff. gracilis LEGE 07310]
MEKGTLVEFRLQGAALLGVVDRPEGKKNWVVLDHQGQPHTLHPRQVTYQVSPSTYKSVEISQFLQEAEKYIDPAHLELAWELLNEAGETVDPASLALLLFSDQRPPLCYAAHRLLSEDKIYFKQKGDYYEPRSANQVEDLLLQVSREAERRQEWESFLSRAQQAIQENSVEWHKSDRPRLELLERYVLLGEGASQRAAAQDVLAALDRGKSIEDAFQLLVDFGLWHEHENLPLRRRQVPVQFSDEVLAVVQHRLANPPPDPDVERVDLTYLKVYTIDDESTREIDDGLSCETLADGRQRLWIHIADPTRWLLPGDTLDLEARRRCTTIYLPTGIVPMFPTELATGPMSLLQGELCCALSFGVVLQDSGEIEDFTICASLIRPTYRLTYEDADEMLQLGIQAEEELSEIAAGARRRRDWRTTQGAISIQLPESQIKVVDDEITIDVLDESPSRQLVAEMMILTGEIAACYGEQHALPIPFRSQPQPELPSEDELMQLPNGWVRDSAIRRCMPRSEMGITPARHSTLGLDRYSQVTSPIRRYTDLLAHFQLKAHLRGEPIPFSALEMTELTQGISTAAYEAVLVERQTKRYWALEYLRRQPDQVWSAILLRWLRQHESLGLVMLEDLGIELAMRFDRPIELGERFQLRVTYAAPRQDTIHLKEVTEKAGTDAQSEPSVA